MERAAGERGDDGAGVLGAEVETNVGVGCGVGHERGSFRRSGPMRASGENEEALATPSVDKPDRKWTALERWQVWIGLLGLLVAIIACVGQFSQ
ncbi:hypothetical protein BG418_12755 [Streptomyces sp. CBMA152]|nr:hypothetical protein [Streptomyces sp. CBMA152]